jgi:hypothetical protein
VIIDPVDGSVDNAIPVKVNTLDFYGNIVMNDNRNILLSTSSVTGPGGTIPIKNGQGVFNLSNTKHEVVFLSLIELSASSLDTSSTQDVLFASGLFQL